MQLVFVAEDMVMETQSIFWASIRTFFLSRELIKEEKKSVHEYYIN